MLKIVTFGDVELGADPSLLVLNRYDVEEAQVRAVLVDVEGAPAPLDFTEYFGEPTYATRSLKFTFTLTCAYADQYAEWQRVHRALNGRKVEVRASDDPGFYWVGRVTVGAYGSGSRVAEFDVTVDAEPWKYVDGETVVVTEVDGSATVEYSNLQKLVRPTFNLTSPMEVEFGGSTFSAPAGEWSASRVRFAPGSNAVTFTGTGTVTATYQERGL